MESEIHVTVRQLVLWVATALTVVVLLGLYLFERARTDELRTQIVLLREVRAVEKEHWTGVAQVNGVCERTVRAMVERLGLPDDVLPLLTKAILERQGGARVVPPVARGVGGVP